MDNGVTGSATRRRILWTMAGAAGGAALAAAAPAATPPDTPPDRPLLDAQVVARNDAALENQMRAQVTGASSPRVGGLPDEYGIFHAGSAGGLIETATASFLAPQSNHHGAPEVLQRIRLADARGQYRSALHQFQFAARHRVRRAQRGHRRGHRQNVRRRRGAERAAALPGESRRRDVHRRDPHAESSMGGEFRARPN